MLGATGAVVFTPNPACKHVTFSGLFRSSRLIKANDVFLAGQSLIF